MLKPAPNKNSVWLTGSIVAILLTGCQTSPAPVIQTRSTPLPEKPVSVPTLVIEEHQQPAQVTAVPAYADNKIQRQPLPSTTPLPIPPQPKVLLRDGSNIPAFTGLLNRAQQQIQANQLNAAEQTLIQAQRIAPQSAAVYAYLSQVALGKKQASNAEAMARKGLMLTSNPRQQHAFWQLILAAAQMQNNAVLAAQARSQMQHLSGQF